MFLTVLSHSFREEGLENGESRVFLKIPPFLLLLSCRSTAYQKRWNAKKAREIMKSLQTDFNCQYEEKRFYWKKI